MSTDVAALCDDLASRAGLARRAVGALTGAERARALHDMADSIRASIPRIIAANERDLGAGADLPSALLDRLRLDEPRLEAMARAVDLIADQPDPVGVVDDGRVLANGIRLEKRRVPIGVILVIYESRPNVTSDAAALCIKAGNAVILRGGKEAANSNAAIMDAIRTALATHGIEDAALLVPTPDRAAIPALLAMRGRLDLCIPRGGPGLMKAVTDVAKIPVVKHDAGNCHLYIDSALDGMEDRAVEIAVNAKTQRPGVCNAIETLLVHRDAAERVLRRIGREMSQRGVELRADEAARAHLPDARPASEEDWATEFLDLILAVRVVESLDEACDHIRTYGSDHTEAIVTSSVQAADRFVAMVDSANVMVNCSTRFADGAEYALGAEIGISTDRLHARGPMGATDLTTFQWVLRGSGQTRV